MHISFSTKQRNLLIGLLVAVFAIVAQLLSESSVLEQSGDVTKPVWFVSTTTALLAPSRNTTSTAPPGALSVSSYEPNALVVRVVDGDTLEVRLDGFSEVQKVRLLGVNTPETVDPRRTVQCFGKQSSSFMKVLLMEKRVRLEADPEADERDKYQRLLRNVILSDGTDVNASLVGSGYAYAYISFPQNKVRKKQLTHLETEAKAMKRGLWADNTCAGRK